MQQKKQPQIFVIVLNFNNKDTILSCLKHIYASQYSNYQVVVVDNASSDGSLEQVKKHFSRAHFIVSGKNLGFACGMNLGIRYALEKGADEVFLVNSDAYIQKETLKTLSFWRKKRGPGIYSPKILTPNGSTWFSLGTIDWFRLRAIHKKTIRRQSSSYESEYVPGCSMLISKEVFKNIGLFDERFFLYYEDVDLCFRARSKGFGVYVISDTSVIHEEKSESDKPKKIYHLVLSANVFFKKNATLGYQLWFRCFHIVRKIKSFYRLRGNPNNALAQSVYRALRSLPYEK